MLVCLACPKQTQLPPLSPATDHDPLSSPRFPPRSPPREPVKSFTTQLKDIVMKFSSGAYRHCRPCTTHDQQDDKSSVDGGSKASTEMMSPTDVLRQFGELSPTRFNLLPTSRRSGHSSEGSHSGRRRSKRGLMIAATDHKRSSARMKLKQSPDHRRDDQLLLEDGFGKENVEGGCEEWVAQVEPGVMITFVALADGSNDLKRIRFSRELFSKWQAQLWWSENCDMVHELYSVTRCDVPCDSSPASSSTPSLHEDALRNTPEVLSSVASPNDSPSRIQYERLISDPALDSAIASVELCPTSPHHSQAESEPAASTADGLPATAADASNWPIPAAENYAGSGVEDDVPLRFPKMSAREEASYQVMETSIRS